MASVQWNGPDETTVVELGCVVNNGDVIEVPDDRWEGYIPPEENRSADHPWSPIDAPLDHKPARKSAAKKKDNN